MLNKMGVPMPMQRLSCIISGDIHQKLQYHSLASRMEDPKTT